jgi:hypothetical protein
MRQIASLVCWLAAGTLAQGQSNKDQFLSDYRKAVAAVEPRLTKNVGVTVTGTSFDELGKPTGSVKFTFHANDTCISVEEVSGPGNFHNWYLLRPEGTYRIVPSATEPSEYVLKRFNPGSYSATEAGPPFLLMAAPFTRVILSLRDHIASSDVTVFSDETNGPFRDLKVREVIGNSVGNTTFRFRTKDMMLEELFGTDVQSSSYRIKYSYVDIDGESYPSRLERFNGKPGEAMLLSGVTEFGPYQRVSFPDSEFSLKRFGLPEPVSESVATRTPAYLWLIAAGGACCLLAVLIRLIRSRMRHEMRVRQ